MRPTPTQIAFGYIRLSDQDQSNYSIDMQDRGIREYCNRYNLVLKDILIDNGESSYTFNRKEYMEVEARLKKEKAQFLIVYHLDRFSRNMAEAILKVRELFSKGIMVRDISEPLDLDDEDPNIFQFRAFKFLNAEGELHRIRKRTKDGMVQAAENGRHANMAPYGYKNARDANGKGIIVIDEEKAPAARMIFREYLNGMGIEAIRKLAALYGYNYKGNSAIQKMLSNPVYAGMVRVPATRGKPARLVQGLHAPLISEADYWLVQEKLHGKTITMQVREDVPLRGVLHCWCGKKVTAGNSKGKLRYYWYYLCPKHRQNLSANRLHAQFDELLDELSFDEVMLEKIKAVAKLKMKKVIDSKEENLKQIRRQLDHVEKRITSTEEKYLRQPDISETTYKKVISELKADQARLYRELAEKNTNHVASWTRLEGIFSTLSNLRLKFHEMQLHQQHKFINWVFDGQLSYENGSYRTPSLNPIFQYKTLTLKEKGLLVMNSPVRNLGITPQRTPEGNDIEHDSDLLKALDKLLSIVAA